MPSKLIDIIKGELKAKKELKKNLASCFVGTLKDIVSEEKAKIIHYVILH